VEDRVGQVWVSRYYDEVDLSKATFFVITARRDDWTNPHTGKVLAYWAGTVIVSEHAEPGRMFAYEEANFISGGDSYDNVYERIT
jgi:hypothetical protein